MGQFQYNELQIQKVINSKSIQKFKMGRDSLKQTCSPFNSLRDEN
jgi:hypothetical protein